MQNNYQHSYSKEGPPTFSWAYFLVSVFRIAALVHPSSYLLDTFNRSKMPLPVFTNPSVTMILIYSENTEIFLEYFYAFFLLKDIDVALFHTLKNKTNKNIKYR